MITDVLVRFLKWAEIKCVTTGRVQKKRFHVIYSDAAETSWALLTVCNDKRLPV